jgi:hypothetical protein
MIDRLARIKVREPRCDCDEPSATAVQHICWSLVVVDDQNKMFKSKALCQGCKIRRCTVCGKHWMED